MIANVAALGPLRFVAAPRPILTTSATSPPPVVLPPFDADDTARTIREEGRRMRAAGFGGTEDFETVILRIVGDRYREPIRAALQRLPPH